MFGGETDLKVMNQQKVKHYLALIKQLRTKVIKLILLTID